MSMDDKITNVLRSYVHPDFASKVKLHINNRGNGGGDTLWVDVTFRLPTGDRNSTSVAAFRMRIAAPEYCCGAVMLEGMSWNFCERYLTKGFSRNRAVEACVRAVVDYLDRYWERSHFLYYVADYQTSIEERLKSCDWQKISEFYNPNSQNMVALYELKINQDRRYEDDYDEDEDW